MITETSITMSCRAALLEQNDFLITYCCKITTFAYNFNSPKKFEFADFVKLHEIMIFFFFL